MRALLATISLALMTGPALAAPIPVVASFSILGDMVKQVGGDRVTVTTIVGPNADTHVYEPKPQDAAVLGTAKAFFVNGLGFEGWLDRLVEATGFKGEVVTASDGVVTHTMDEDGQTITDPHAWQSLGNGQLYVANIAKGLAEADPANAAHYRERAEAFDRRLVDLDAWVKEEIAKVPADKRRAITGHDSFRYFSAAYGVKFQSPRGYNTSSEPSARDVAALIRQIREQRIKALFIENMTNPGLVEQIARESGAVVGARLYSDALSGPDGPAPTYEKMMRYNVSALVAGMAKN